MVPTRLLSRTDLSTKTQLSQQNILTMLAKSNFPPRRVSGPRPPVTFYDRPMGTGKTKALINGFDPNSKYLVVHDYLDQFEQVLNNPCNVAFVQPEAASGRTKAAHLETLVKLGLNVVTTHKLYPTLAELAKQGWLKGYTIVIDETLDPIAVPQCPKVGTWEALVKDGYATVESSGKVVPTDRWASNKDAVSDVLSGPLFDVAKSGRLYVTDRSHFFLIPMPAELLTSGNSVTIMTFMAEGSTLAAYLTRMGIPYVIDRDEVLEKKLRADIRQHVTLLDIPSLRNVSFSFSQQTAKCSPKDAKRVATALKNLRGRKLNGISLDVIMIGCAKENFYAKRGSAFDTSSAGPFLKGSKMFGANKVAPGIRGTNDYRHCSVVISLYDYHLHPAILHWLGKSSDKAFQERYALSELLQFIYRSRIRNRDSITDPSILLFLPCKRMRDIFLSWVNQDAPEGEPLVVSR